MDYEESIDSMVITTDIIKFIKQNRYKFSLYNLYNIIDWYNTIDYNMNSTWIMIKKL